MANLVPVYVDKQTGNVIATNKISNVNLLYNAFGYIHDQQTATTQWIINHNKNAQGILFQIYTTNMEPVIPDSVVVNNANQVTINFTSPMSGKAHLILFRTE